MGALDGDKEEFMQNCVGLRPKHQQADYCPPVGRMRTSGQKTEISLLCLRRGIFFGNKNSINEYNTGNGQWTVNKSKKLMKNKKSYLKTQKL